MGIVTLTVEGSSKINPTVPLSVRNPLGGPEIVSWGRFHPPSQSVRFGQYQYLEVTPPKPGKRAVTGPVRCWQNRTASGTRFPDLKSSRGVGPEIVSGGRGESQVNVTSKLGIRSIKRIQQDGTLPDALHEQSVCDDPEDQLVLTIGVKVREFLQLFTQHDRDQFHYLDVTPITSRSYTHPSPSQTSRPLTSSLSLGVPVPRVTQCL